MANVLLTTACNLSCSYCFAQERIKEKGCQYITLDNARQVIAFLKKSQFPIFRMMGGEPTLHPQFEEIVQNVLAEGLDIDLLSNATWSDEHTALFHKISPAHLRFLLNIDHPSSYTKQLWKRIRTNLAAIAGRKGITLSFNIFEKDPRYGYVLDLASEFAIPYLRVSFSLPVVGVKNAALPLSDYFKVSGKILEMAREAEKRGISMRLDNAVPLCIFSFEEVGELLMKGVLNLEKNARCKPIIDIAPDLTVCNCFCLSMLHNRSLTEFSTLEELYRYYEALFRHYQDDVFSMERCLDCEYRRLWGCQGGCTAFYVGNSDTVLLDAREKKDCVELTNDTKVALADDVSVTKYTLPETSYTLKKSGRQPIEVTAPFERLLQLLGEPRSVTEILRSHLPDLIDNPDPIDLFEQQTVDETLKGMLTGMLCENYIEIVL
jgi:radical SAM protein with 4Fe4S-binding SPASM domain